MTLELYGYALSQPARTIMSFCELMGISYQLNLISVLKMEQKKPEFVKINPSHKIPALTDNSKNLTIFESEAILKYLAFFYTSHCVEKMHKWYPTGQRDDKLEAVRMQMYLSWHHTNLRQSSMIHIGVWAPIKDKANTIRRGRRFLVRSLDFIEKHWLNKGDYIVGDHPTVADLQAVHEIVQFGMLPTEEYWKEVLSPKRPTLLKWLDRMLAMNEVQKFIQEAVSRKITAKF